MEWFNSYLDRQQIVRYNNQFQILVNLQMVSHKVAA